MNRKRQPLNKLLEERFVKAELGELLGEDVQLGVSNIPVNKIVLPPTQPRRYFAPEKMQRLVESVKRDGILEPLLVRPLDNNGYELVAGERRYRAAIEVGLTEVPVVVRSLTDAEAMKLSLVENLCREDLNPVEETEGILQLLGMKLEQSPETVIALLHRMQNEATGKVTHNVMGNAQASAVEELFTGLGLMSWESFVKNRLPLLNLPGDILEVLRCGKLEYTKALVISRIKDDVKRQSILEKAISQSLSLSQIRELIKTDKSPLADMEKQRQQKMKLVSKILKEPAHKHYEQLNQLWQQIERLLAED